MLLTPGCPAAPQNIWMFTLPAALFPVCGWYTVPVSAVIAFLMYGIEHIGVFIEEPFSYLQLHAIVSAASP